MIPLATSWVLIQRLIFYLLFFFKIEICSCYQWWRLLETWFCPIAHTRWEAFCSMITTAWGFQIQQCRPCKSTYFPGLPFSASIRRCRLRLYCKYGFVKPCKSYSKTALKSVKSTPHFIILNFSYFIQLFFIFFFLRNKNAFFSHYFFFHFPQ